MPRKLRGSRKPSAVLDCKLRIRQSLRRQIAQAAEKNGVTLNAEMVRRLDESFTREKQEALEEVTRRLENVLFKAESLVSPAPATKFTASAPALGEGAGAPVTAG